MRYWDLSGGAAKLELALESLQTARAEAARSWQDAASGKFDETYLLPLEPRLRRALDAIHRLDAVLSEARRACDG